MKPMNLEVLRLGPEDHEMLDMAHEIRNKVFVGELDIDPNLEYDMYEGAAHHYLVKLDGKPVGTARWRETEEGIRLERFAVLPEERNHHIGKVLLKEILKEVIPLGKKIFLHAQLKAVPFYERNGFRRSGEIFFEARYGHYYMEYKG
jgi:predicted GNAT family N-acyltransferase